MKISFNWLRELVELPADADAESVAAALTGRAWRSRHRAQRA